MKILLITVAGTSSRFSKSVGYPCLKCLYHKNDIKESLLYRLLHHDVSFDKYVIVGGFKFDELQFALVKYFQDLASKILLVKNLDFAKYGSGYSLYQGLKSIINEDFSEIVFAEGDLFVDEGSFTQIFSAPNNVITRNDEAILANKAVAFYFDLQEKIHYIYDTSHNYLEIKGPFLGVFNSGQIWKFTNKSLLQKAFASLKEQDWQGTNLNLIQAYFGNLDKHEYEIVEIKGWLNCNTVDDFNKITT